MRAASGLPAATVERWAALEPYLIAAAEDFGVPLALVTAVAYVESRFKTKALSRAGAAGIMQIMPKTRRYLLGKLGEPDFDPLADTAQNIRLGAYYIARLIRRWRGRPIDWALASYYAGAGNVATHGPGMYGRYVEKVRQAEKAIELTYARCSGAPWAADNQPHFPGQKRPSPGRRDVTPTRTDETPGSGGPAPERAPEPELANAALLGVGLIGALIAFRERRTRG